MKQLAVTILAISIFCSISGSQLVQAQRPADYLQAYSKGDIKKLEKLFNSEKERFDPFLKAIFEKDGERAVEYYREVLKNSPFADEALPAVLERVALYYYAKGLYNTAKKSFSYIAQNFPQTRFGEFGFYYVGRCWEALGMRDSSRKTFEKFVLNYPRSRYTQLVLNELKKGHFESAAAEASVTKSRNSGRSQKSFKVQTGAFSTLHNARIQSQFFWEKGIKTEIYQKNIRNRRYFVVCIGNFPNQREADQYGKALSRKYHLDYRVVNGNELFPVRF